MSLKSVKYCKVEKDESFDFQLVERKRNVALEVISTFDILENEEDMVKKGSGQ